MATTARTHLRRRLGVLIAGAAVLTALTTATAGASLPPSEAGPATGPTRRDAGTSPGSKLPCQQVICVFVQDKGRLTAFAAPGQGTSYFPRINNRGQIVGTYIKQQSEPLDVFGGYLRDRRGRTTTFDVPGAASTLPMDLNDHGQIVGIQQIDAQGTSRGFLRDARGRYVTIQVPGAVTTQAFGINNQGLVVGDYYRADGVQHGFVWRRGRFTTIDGPRGTGATLTDLDDRGRVIGVSSGDPANPGTAAGFQLQGRRYTTVAVPGAPLTFPLAVNNRGEIVGFSALRFALEEDSDTHGFLLRSGAGGAFTRIDVPGAFGSGATGINDHGTIVGLYGNPDAAQRPQRAGMPSMPTAR